ncbi:thioester reductase domain-containing protein [Streptomyces sp. NPDC087440]|uniref:thioester reductase domain-containing protein n=1 Tax=Streptomyces sp. NPDC087440 TaxID=3365790 RepID=UPI00380A5FDA
MIFEHLAHIVAAPDVHLTDEPRHILLTDATGFLGSFLLRDLLRNTSARIHCLVRGTDASDARARLTTAATWYETGADLDFDRIDIAVGDLAEPALGRDEGAFDELARVVDVVHHTGASVNWLYPYEALRPANIAGTEEVLRLAARHRTIPVHYISSTGVHAQEPAEGRRIAVDDPIGPPELLSNGYRQAKRIAEGIIDIARSRGIPVSVYRVDVVSGDQVNGACQKQDFVWLSIRGMLEVGVAPAGISGFFHPTPVDYVSAAIRWLSSRIAGVGDTFNLSNPHRLHFTEIVERLRALGHTLVDLDPAEWSQSVCGSIRRTRCCRCSTSSKPRSRASGAIPTLTRTRRRWLRPAATSTAPGQRGTCWRGTWNSSPTRATSRSPAGK